jgi:hypothetical protein
MQEKKYTVDFCVVGGGLAGLSAAIAASRKGLKVVLVHDRPVLGGNASSEIRMWILGAKGNQNHETGIIEELLLENSYRNPNGNWSIWDSILYEKVRFEENITLLLNCTCNGINMNGSKIRSVRAWQMTTETWYTIEADYFADCSGDSILAPLSGAEFRLGREARGEFGESLAPEKADNLRIGQGIIIQAREMTTPQKFIPPTWAYKYESDDDFPAEPHNFRDTNFWWLEVGNIRDTIHESQDIHDELLKMAFGVWDHLKNHGDHNTENWALDWIGFLPAKQESRRYVGDYILTQRDVENGARFDDAVAYGGWPLEDHPVYPYKQKGKAIDMYSIPIYHIPYRCLYSRNIDNLFFAGRNISTSHMALTSTRVMATCSICGQAIGTAAAIAKENNLSPRGVYKLKIKELQAALKDDDCYIPGQVAEIPELTRSARLESSDGDAEVLRNGINRTLDDIDNGWWGNVDSEITFSFDRPEKVSQLSVVFDSNFIRNGVWEGSHPKNMPNYYPLERPQYKVPETLVKNFRIEAEIDGVFQTVANVKNNHQRLVKVDLNVTTKKVKFIPEETWGADKVHIFSITLR